MDWTMTYNRIIHSLPVPARPRDESLSSLLFCSVIFRAVVPMGAATSPAASSTIPTAEIKGRELLQFGWDKWGMTICVWPSRKAFAQLKADASRGAVRLCPSIGAS